VDAPNVVDLSLEIDQKNLHVIRKFYQNLFSFVIWKLLILIY